jgi:hypothetical protein
MPASSACEFFNSKERPSLWVKTLEVRVQLCGPDPFGPISAACLRLRCSSLLLVSIRTGGDSSGEQILILGHESFTWHNSLEDSFPHHEERIQIAYALPVYGNYHTGGIIGLLLEPTGQKRVIPMLLFEKINMAGFIILFT